MCVSFILRLLNQVTHYHNLSLTLRHLRPTERSTSEFLAITINVENAETCDYSDSTTTDIKGLIWRAVICFSRVNISFHILTAIMNARIRNTCFFC